MEWNQPHRKVVVKYLTVTISLLLLFSLLPLRAEYFALDFRWKPTASNLVNCDFCILDIQSAPDLGPGHAAGKKFFSYMSVGQIAGNAPYLADVLARGVRSLSYNVEWNSYYPDLADPRWADYVIWHLAPIALNKGFDGFFLDTVDAVETVSALQPHRAQAHRDGMINLIRGLKAAYPTKQIILNRGFVVFDAVKTLVKGMLVEELFQRDDYSARSADGISQLLARIQPVKNAGLPVYIVDYVPASDLALADATAERISNLGFHPLIVPQELHGIILAPRLPVVTRPANASVWAGNTWTFSAGASGTPPLYYQWFCNGNSLAGAERASLVLQNVALSQAGEYSVVVRNAAGSMASSTATLTVNILDADQDRMPDDWERLHGLQPNFAGDAQAIPIMIVSPTWMNIGQGLIPEDPRSCLKLQVGRAIGNKIPLVLQVMADRSYTVEYRSVHGNGSWSKLRDISAEAATRTVTVDYPLNDLSSAGVFRVVTPSR